MLFNLQVFGDFPASLLLLSSALIPLWSESTLSMICIVSDLLRYVLWSRMSVLVNVPCELEKNVYLADVG
jgi:hypothetical protein